jgi:hypothetical protein
VVKSCPDATPPPFVLLSYTSKFCRVPRKSARQKGGSLWGCARWNPDLACIGGKCKFVSFGAPCSTPGGACAWGMYCTPNGLGESHCLPLFFPHESCGKNFCPLSEHCVDPSTGKCAPFVADGAPCDADPLHCANRCNPVTQKCAPWPVCAAPSCVACDSDPTACAEIRVGDPCSGNSCDDPDIGFQQNYPMVCLDGQCERKNPACEFPEGSP